MKASQDMDGGPGLIFGLSLGFLSVLGPLAIDLYLAAMPEMVTELNAGGGSIQRTLSAFFFGLALAQIPVGFLGDRFGRRRPLLCGLLLFAATSGACALAQTVDQLVALRFLQGMAACVGTSTARAIIRDRHSGHQAARLMAFTFLIIGVSPVVAPLLGSLLLLQMGWRGLFIVLALAGLAALAAVAMALPETHPPERRARTGLATIAGLKAPLSSMPFLGWTLVAGLATTVPFSFATAAPFLYTRLFGLEGSQYTLLLGLNAVCSIVATQFAPNLMRKYGAGSIVVAAGAPAIAASAAVALFSSAHSSLLLFQLWSMAVFIASGLILTPAATSAFDAVKSGAGAAAGLLGTLQLAVTAVASAIISLLPSSSILPLVLLPMSGFAVSVSTVWLISPRMGSGSSDPKA